MKQQVQGLLEPVQLVEIRKEAKRLAADILNQGRQEGLREREILTKRKGEQEGRLTSLENALLDGLIQPSRYTIRRDELIADLKDIELRLTTMPQPVMPDLERLFTILDAITWENLDDEAWRELLEMLINKVTLKDDEATVDWRPICQPLISVCALL